MAIRGVVVGGLALLVLAACSARHLAIEACEDTRDARSAACMAVIEEYYRGAIPSPRARPVHATKTAEQYRADRYDCEQTLFGRDGSTFGGDPSIDEVRQYYILMPRCLEGKHGWRWDPDQ
jgi:hypothetical protein